MRSAAHALAFVLAGWLVGGCASCTATEPEHRTNVTSDRIVALIESRLAEAHEATARELDAKAPARRVMVGDVHPMPHSDGRALMAMLVLEPGKPGNLGVSTELGLHFGIALDDHGTPTITGRPTRDELVIAIRLAIAGEARAFAAATAALKDAGVKPPGRSWSAALRSASLDPRLPRNRMIGTPDWQFLFAPFGEHGWTSVIIDATSFTPTDVNGHSP